MPLRIGESRAEKCGNELLRQRWSHDTGAKAENVHRIVLDALMGRESVVAERGANAIELVGRHRGADAAAADEHTTIRSVFANRHRDSLRVVRIVVPGDELRGTAIDNVVARGADHVHQPIFQRKPRVIGANGYSHRSPRAAAALPLRIACS